MIAFGSFCLAASSIYLLNDILDREEDARHPKKRSRPIASGRLPVRAAWLVLAGSLDPCIEPGLYAPHPASFAAPFRVEMVPGAGHFLPLEAPDTVADRFLAFVKRLNRKAPGE